jgi:hypothetical protein
MTKAVLDYETKSSYMVTVTATDGEDTASIDVTITVTDVIDTPINRFDTNSNGMIEESEVLGAIDDYFNPDISVTEKEVLDLIDLYFA